ncbi:MAG: hypothetical protein LBL41_00860 [Bifidobacteriaceae bacterium]|jgi:XTP/dITP diphosphohydrolase|nr:hypothetical protein [Bifidobacteriaceae bacterium]
MTREVKNIMTPKLIFATHNQKKTAEFTAILSSLLQTDIPKGYVISAKDAGLEDVVENGVTFAENARIKAEHAFNATGIPSVGDDSGLMVRVMNGCPGIFSARWAGMHYSGSADSERLFAERTDSGLLLAQLADIPLQHRGAKFSCTMHLTLSADKYVVQTGEVHGAIATAKSGANGFGYDPIFAPFNQNPLNISTTTIQHTSVKDLLSDPNVRLFADFEPREKDAISHRYEAMKRLAGEFFGLMSKE